MGWKYRFIEWPSNQLVAVDSVRTVSIQKYGAVDNDYVVVLDLVGGGWVKSEPMEWEVAKQTVRELDVMFNMREGD